MNVQKLFHVLVLGGAAITGCGDETPNDDGGTSGDAGGDDGTTGNTSTTTAAGSGGADATTTGSGGDGGAGITSGSGGEGGAVAPECSDKPDPSDACGCPCCWASGPNTDEEVCAGFCDSGNDGAGCCGL